MINTPSPLRYPGGKTVLYEKVKNIINQNISGKCTYIEPFAGGCGLALKLLFNSNVEKVIINDYDYAIYCIWDSILNNNEQYVEKINNINIDIEEWNRQRYIYENKQNYSKIDIAIATLFLNRTNISGVIKGGPIGGIKQNGKYKIDCRFNKKTLINKIQKIYNYKDKIELYNMEANEFIKKIITKREDNTFIYLDPPYFQKGPILYKNFFNKENHKELSNVIKDNLENYNWIVTYDNNEIIKEMYNTYKIETFDLPYSAGNNKKGKEIMIYSNMLKYKGEN